MEYQKNFYNKNQKGRRYRQSLTKSIKASLRTVATKHTRGEIYFIVAHNFHGLFPGCFLYRCKIGLALDAKKRLERLESIQAPCNYKLIKTIQVRDMAAVEKLLHERFAPCNVKLKRSREWFDLNIWQLWCAFKAFDYYANHPNYGSNNIPRFPWRAIALGIAGLLITFSFFHPANISHKPLQNIHHKN